MGARLAVWRDAFWHRWYGILNAILVAGSIYDATREPLGDLPLPPWWTLLTAMGLFALGVALESLYRSSREWAAAMAALNKKRHDQTFADELTVMLESGTHKLLAAPIDSENEFIEWIRYEGAWRSELVGRMKTHGCTVQEINSIELLGDLALEPNRHAEPARNRELRMHNVRLKRLRRIIDLYSGNPVLSAANTEGPHLSVYG